jgi:hypothetical protein
MNRRFLHVLIAVLVAALSTIGCKGENPFETPTNPGPAPTVTETFSGDLGRNGARTHNFSTSASGSVTATLTTLVPDSALVIGFSLGTWNGSVCNIVLAKDDATQGTVVTGGVSSFGSLCVRIYDVGNVTEQISYEITIVHP